MSPNYTLSQEGRTNFSRFSHLSFKFILALTFTFFLFTPYLYSAQATLPANGIMDNGSQWTTFTGNWVPSSGQNPYSSNSLYSNRTGNTFTFQASEANGSYEVSLWWTYYRNRCDSVPVDIYDGNTLIDTVYVDQLSNGGQWNILGTYEFNGTARIVIHSLGGGTTCADAVKIVTPVSDPPVLPQDGIMDNVSQWTTFTGNWVPSSGQNPYSSNSLYSNRSGNTFTFQASEANGSYEVSLWWTYYYNRCDSVPVDIYDGNTLIDTVYVDQLSNGGQWNILGTYGFNGTARVVINSQGGCTTSADAVKLMPVSNPPVLSPIGHKTIDEAQTLDFTVSATDADGDILSYAVSNLPFGALFNKSTNTFSWTPTYDQSGNYANITFQVSDGKDTDTESITIIVNSTNRTPVIDPITDITVNEGNTVSLNPTATDPDGDPLTFTYSGWMSSNSYTTSYDDAGVHTVKITVSDGSSTNSQDVAITVKNVNRTPVLDSIANITVSAGVTISINPTATDLDGDPLTFTYSGWMNSNSYTTSYDDAGVHTVKVSVTDGSSTVTQDVSITVLNANRPPVLDLIANITVNEGDTVTLNPTATDLDGDPLTFTCSGWMSSNNYTTSYDDAGVHTVTVTVSDGSLTDSQDVTITVNEGTVQLTFEWEDNTEPELAGYKIYYGNSSRNYNAHVDVGNQTSYFLTGLASSETYYIAATAYDSSGNESGYSQEVVYNILPTNGIIDNDDPGILYTGNWVVSSGPNPYGANSLYSNKSGNTYTFQASEVYGPCEVLLYWTYYNNRCDSVPVDIYDGNSLLETIYLDQLENGGQWNLLGTYEFSGTARLVINSQGICTTSADAVKFYTDIPAY